MIVIYSKPDCQPCNGIKMFFDRKGVRYTVRDVTDPKWMDKLVSEYHVSTVPVTIMSPDPRHVVVGGNIKRIAEILRSM